MGSFSNKSLKTMHKTMDAASATEKIGRFIRRKVKRAGANGAVMGISGGLDSAVVATLCARALGPDSVMALIMPSPTNSHHDVQDAREMAADLGIHKKIIPLEGIQQAFLEHLPPDKTAKGNLTARIRMCLLYYYANHLNYLVVGTGNKSELSVGYFTKHGDGGCDILPIGDLLKTEVRQLARFLEVPRKIISKQPTAGLWLGQTDEAEMGMSYKWLDKVLAGNAKSNKVERMIKNSKHKRRTPEVCRI